MLKKLLPLNIDPRHIPSPPAIGFASTLNSCRWMIAVMDTDDPCLKLVTEVFLHLLDNKEMTEAQRPEWHRCYGRLIKYYETGVLDCQNDNIPVKTKAGAA